ncbi:MAG: PEP-CTERM sorting domain-containing protein [Phycisphaerales bacterium]|nr:PEP-CTERM sorting domain-containing protein [Phycisphaerales bacterium]
MRYQKFMLAPVAVGGALILCSAQTARGDFSGAYSPANWTFNANGGDGSVNTLGAPLSITITGNDNSNGVPTNTDYTIAAVASGTWSFDWAFIPTDTGNYDHGGYLLNGVYTQLANNLGPGPFPGPNPSNGVVSIGINAGDIIGFRVYSDDGFFGAADMTITNFVAPVPAPGALALLGVAGLAGTRKRRRL